MNLSNYEQRVLREVSERKERHVAGSPRTIVPRQVSQRAVDLTRKAGRLPGASKVADAYTRALQGAVSAAAKTSTATLSEDRVLCAFRRRGVVVATLEDIRALDLFVVERRVKPKRMDLAYASLAAAEGAAAGAVITGGQLLATVGTVASAGAASAPGLGTVAAAMAADTAVVLAASQRVVSHTALYYGYDPFDPAEATFTFSVLNLGSAITAGGKVAAYRELSQLTQMLARRATWEQLNKYVLPQIAQRFAVQFGGRLTQRKLGQLIPVVGIGAGALLNFKLVDDIAEAAHWAYRERFLLAKHGDAGPAPVVPLEPGGPTEGAPEKEIDLLGIINDATRPDPGMPGGRPSKSQCDDGCAVSRPRLAHPERTSPDWRRSQHESYAPHGPKAPRPATPVEE